MRHGGDRRLTLVSQSARRILGTLALAALGGALFVWLGLPLPWMLGAMLATTGASLAGAPLRMPADLRAPMIAVLGVMLGSGFSEDLVRSIPRWLPSVLGLMPHVLILGGATFLYLRRVERLDTRTAFFSSAPGGLSEMIVLGDRMGGDVRTISLVHATRILLIVSVVPFLARHLGTAPALGPDVQAGYDPATLAALVATGAVGFWLGQWLRLPAGPLVGPMLLSAVAHALGLIEGGPPPAVVALAQLVIGASIGVRFAGFSAAAVVRAIRSGVVLTTLMLLLSAGLASLVAMLTETPFLHILLAYIPGGLAEMSLVALSLGIEPAFVALHHIIRIAIVVAAAPLLFRLAGRNAERRP